MTAAAAAQRFEARPLAAVALLLLVALCACRPRSPPAEAPRPVETVVVGRATGATYASYPGQITPRYEASLAFQRPGQIREKLADVGTLVKAGQALASLDSVDAELGELSASAEARAATSLAQQQATDLARARELLSQGFISQAEFDRDQVGRDAARAQLTSTLALRSASARQVGHTVLRAPRAGVITAFTGDVGEVVQPSQSIVKIADPAVVEAMVAIPEGEVGRFRQAALQVRIWSFPGKSYPGTLRSLSPAADPQTRTFEARVAFGAPPGAALIGSTAEVEARSAVVDAWLRVPIAALSQRDRRSVVWVVAGSPPRASPREVKVHEVQQNAVLIAGGLGPGERIAAAGVHLLHPGDLVRPVAPAEPSP